MWMDGSYYLLQVSVRVRDKSELSTLSVDDLISLFRDEVAAYR